MNAKVYVLSVHPKLQAKITLEMIQVLYVYEKVIQLRNSEYEYHEKTWKII